MKLLGAFLFALSALYAADDDPVEVLIRVRDRVMEHATRIPNYTCVETIVRDWYDLAGAAPPRSCDALLGRRKRAGAGTLVTLATTDRLRLDVAVADSREIYSWAGAGRFEEKDIDELIPVGAIGSGPFAATLLGIFDSREPHFVFEGDTTLNSRRVLEYSFNVTQDESHSRVKAGSQWVITGYTGRILVDPVTADLLRVTVRTEELPKPTNLCEVDSAMDYGMIKLDGAEYLLPSMTRERFINQDGAEAENAVTFAACREFRGESTVNFGASVAVAGGSPLSGAPGLDLPAGLPVAVILTSAIDTNQAAAGDAISGILAAPVLDAARKIELVKQGAAVEGRLMRVEKRYAHPNEVTIVLRWETLEVNGVKTPLQLLPDRLTASRMVRSSDQLQQRGMAITLPRFDESRYAAFHFQGENVVVRDGLRSLWLTARP
ncbi:MAG TPA: hypothetical protein VG456_23095 [Candidatus Sulfopaludibacter sp.]|jgi:hypothetical protein|nr:hypothetical protein [Candidatus Sulfopaludibacter sp.]